LARCGDLIVDSIEECDDGNRVARDGCDRDCTIEDDEEYKDDEDNYENNKEETLVAGEITSPYFAPTPNPLPPTPTFGFPQYPSYQQLPYQLPLASLQPLIQGQGPIGETGPAAVAVGVSGIAAGIGWIRRKRR